MTTIRVQLKFDTRLFDKHLNQRRNYIYTFVVSVLHNDLATDSKGERFAAFPLRPPTPLSSSVSPSTAP